MNITKSGDGSTLPALQQRSPARRMLREAREAKGLSLRQVADACGINIRQYQKFESGERDVRGCSFALGLKLCETLGLDPWAFAAPEVEPAPKMHRGPVRALHAEEDATNRAPARRGDRR